MGLVVRHISALMLPLVLSRTVGGIRVISIMLVSYKVLAVLSLVTLLNGKV